MLQVRDLNGTDIRWIVVNRQVTIDDSDFNLYQFKIQNEVFIAPSKQFYELLSKHNTWAGLQR